MFYHRRKPQRSEQYGRPGTNWAACLGCAALGAGLMCLLDPAAGARRRSLIRDKFVRSYHAAGNSVRTTAVHARNRFAGYAHEARARFTEGFVPDDTLKDRVRSKIGRLISHPGSIGVTVQDAVVTLHGPIFAHEVAPLLRAVCSIRGVCDVRNRLSPHEIADHIPGLQGEGSRR